MKNLPEYQAVSSRFVSMQFPSLKERSWKKLNADDISSIPYLKQTPDKVGFRRDWRDINCSSCFNLRYLRANLFIGVSNTDALRAFYRVSLVGVIDIQLLENASCADDKKYIHGLDKFVQFDLKLGFIKIHHRIHTKKELKTFIPTSVFAA